MDARSLARLQALGRLGLGAGLMLAPGVVAGGWVGGVADRREGQALAIAAGARDVAIARRRAARARATVAAPAAGSARACSPTPPTRTPTWRARDSLPPLAVPAVLAIAGGSALLGVWLQAAVD